jgi:hypothetical protein
MARSIPRLFTKPDFLRKLNRFHLVEFLKPYANYLSQKGFALSEYTQDNIGVFDVNLLSEILINSSEAAPKELVEGLYAINDLSSNDGFDALIKAIHGSELESQIASDITNADLALQVWMRNRVLFERVRDELLVFKGRVYQYYKSRYSASISVQPSQEQIQAIERSLNEWYKKNRRGSSAKISVCEKGDFLWFLIRHGDPFKREPVIENGESGSLFFQPEKYDVLVYNHVIREIRIYTKTKGQRELYRNAIGYHLFGDQEYFDVKSKFTLEPLRTEKESALQCADIKGIDWIRLKEIHFQLGGNHRTIEVIKSEDVFESIKEWGNDFPETAVIIKAAFLIKFTDAVKPRSIVLNGNNRAQLSRDDDAEIIEQWLALRGFIVNTENFEYA